MRDEDIKTHQTADLPKQEIDLRIKYPQDE